MLLFFLVLLFTSSFFLLSDGQSLERFGVLGGYSFYNYGADYFLLELEKIVSLKERMSKSYGGHQIPASAASLPVALSLSSKDFYFMAASPDGGHVPPGFFFLPLQTVQLFFSLS